MAVVTLGRRALVVALLGALAAPAHAVDHPHGIVVEGGEAWTLMPGDKVFTSGGPARGSVSVRARGSLDAYRADIRDGIAVTGGATAQLRATTISTGAERADAVSVTGAMSSFTAHDTTILATGRQATALALHGGSATIHGGDVQGAGYAVRAGSAGGPASVAIDGGARVTGRIANGTQAMRATIIDSSVSGDVASGKAGTLAVAMERSTWHGRSLGVASITLASSAWRLTGDSSVSQLALRHDARVGFADGTGMGTLRVGTLDNAGDGIVTLRTRVDAGGPLARQLTDRLLVDGDVTGGTTIHVVNAGGVGGNTSPLTLAPMAGDGISLVQVGGRASEASFSLAGDYVAVGPWRYGLVAYEPGTTDATQRLVPGTGDNHWDFRLQSLRTDANGVMVTARKGAPAHGGAERARFVPQVPTYLVLSNALFGYGRAAIDALAPVDTSAPRDGAWRVRAFGGQASYRSDLPFARYGVDYRRSDRGLQVAGDLMAWSSGATLMRTGIALSTGGTRIAPRAVDGVSRANVASRGIAAIHGFASEGGWRVDASYGFTHHRIDVDTPQRGQVMGRFRANANEASLGAGFRWQATDRLVIEPGASMVWQRLRFVTGRDRDGLVVRPGSPERVTLRGGARVAMNFEPRGDSLVAWSPYIDARYVATQSNGTPIDVSGVGIATGGAGKGIETAAGIAVQFRGNITAHVDVTDRHRIGRAGESAWGARAGVAYTF